MNTKDNSKGKIPIGREVNPETHSTDYSADTDSNENNELTNQDNISSYDNSNRSSTDINDNTSNWENTSSNGDDELNYSNNSSGLNDSTALNNATSLTPNNSDNEINSLLSLILEATNNDDYRQVGRYIDDLLLNNNLILLEGLLLRDDFCSNNLNLHIALEKISQILEEKQKHYKNSMSNDKDNDNNTHNLPMDNDIQILRTLQDRLINMTKSSNDAATSSNYNHNRRPPKG